MDARVTEFGVAEAKAKFSELLGRVEAGEEIAIRKHGQRIARLVPVKPKLTVEEKRQKIAEYLAWRKEHGPRLGPGLTTADLVRAGRKY